MESQPKSQPKFESKFKDKSAYKKKPLRGGEVLATVNTSGITQAARSRGATQVLM